MDRRRSCRNCSGSRRRPAKASGRAALGTAAQGGAIRATYSGERRSAVGPFPPPCLPARFARPRRACAGAAPRRPHAIGRADAAGGALGFRVLTRPEDRSRAPVPTRWRASADARGARLRRLGAPPSARAPSLHLPRAIPAKRSARRRAPLAAILRYYPSGNCAQPAPRDESARSHK